MYFRLAKKLCVRRAQKREFQAEIAPELIETLRKLSFSKKFFLLKKL